MKHISNDQEDIEILTTGNTAVLETTEMAVNMKLRNEKQEILKSIMVTEKRGAEP